MALILKPMSVIFMKTKASKFFCTSSLDSLEVKRTTYNIANVNGYMKLEKLTDQHMRVVIGCILY